MGDAVGDQIEQMGGSYLDEQNQRPVKRIKLEDIRPERGAVDPSSEARQGRAAAGLVLDDTAEPLQQASVRPMPFQSLSVSSSSLVPPSPLAATSLLPFPPLAIPRIRDPPPPLQDTQLPRQDLVSMHRPWSGNMLDSWNWPGSPSIPPPPPPPSQMLLGLQPSNFVGMVPTASPSSPTQSASSAFSAPDFSSSPTSPHCPPPPHVSKRSRYPLPPPPPPGGVGVVDQQFLDNFTLVSPFRDCVGNFGNASHRRFLRPIDGKVNGYIKFNWPTDKTLRRESLVPESTVSESPPQATDPSVTAVEDDSSHSSLVPFRSTSASSKVMMALSPELDANFDFSSLFNGSAVSYSFELLNATPTSPPVKYESSSEIASMGAPRKVPQLFGYEAKMDQTDRKLWTFYIRNWCPGRSVLLETNLWLKDFAQMHKSDGVLAAIQSLAGIYIYDYKPIDSVRKRVNDRFFEAESRLSRLLNDPSTSRNEAQANELITIAVLLSMQDIVLTERRRRKPCDPRWLAGFKHSELFLQATDQGSRFWNPNNAQLSSLRISQSVIVGRAIILAQPMMILPPAETFDPEYETSRFGWLLYGTERDMYQIHGGCGFSKKLLHIFSQITYCAARLHQDPKSMVVPTTTQYLHAELVQMRQWSSESKDWEAAKAGLSVTEWARSVPADHVISSSADMTDVTAEAWRLTAIIYLQCRVWRLPRNQPAVLSTLSDLARCIQIMPTSGYHFTAQAPLFPVFLLGMLSIDPVLRNVSKTWFDEVVSTPVRSSVPPLYEALQRIWEWIDAVVPPPPPTDTPLGPIGLRCPWWEQVVHEVDKREQEVLCLT